MHQGDGLPALNMDWVQVKRVRNVYPVYQRGYRDQLYGARGVGAGAAAR